MNGKKMIYSVVALVALLFVYFGWKFTSRSAYESAEYQVIDAEGPFEIRQYSDLMLVSTDLPPQARGDDGRFMRLFRYIDGANKQSQKVAMTTPVFMGADSEDSSRQMSFVIPKNVSQRQIPEPTNEKLEIQKRPGGRFAVIRFSGRLNKQTIKAAEQKLEQWLEKKTLARAGAIESAGYDPPWTPGPLRRNEVLVRLN